MSNGQQMKVFINPMKLLDWEPPPMSAPGTNPTPEDLLRFLCPLDMPTDMPAFKKRYSEASAKDRDLFLSIQESGIVENLFGPLRQAKTNYILGNYVGAIALCGIVAEKVAIFVHAVEIPEDAKREAFEAMDQYRRVQELKDSGWITPQSVQDFGDIRAARKKYLHYWTSINDERTAKDAVLSYAAATRLVVAAMGFGFSEGSLTLKPSVAAYLRARGPITANAEGA